MLLNFIKFMDLFINLADWGFMDLTSLTFFFLFLINFFFPILSIDIGFIGNWFYFTFYEVIMM